MLVIEAAGSAAPQPLCDIAITNARYDRDAALVAA